jgi:hypothetical protein
MIDDVHAKPCYADMMILQPMDRSMTMWSRQLTWAEPETCKPQDTNRLSHLAWSYILHHLLGRKRSYSRQQQTVPHDLCPDSETYLQALLYQHVSEPIPKTAHLQHLPPPPWVKPHQPLKPCFQPSASSNENVGHLNHTRNNNGDFIEPPTEPKSKREKLKGNG